MHFDKPKPPSDRFPCIFFVIWGVGWLFWFIVLGCLVAVTGRYLGVW